MFYKIKPTFNQALWAGNKLKYRYHKTTNLDSISDSIEFSLDDNSMPQIQGAEKTVPLKDYLKSNYLGKNLENKEPNFFIRLIDSSDLMPVEVSPSDDYAIINHNRLGDNKLWYILDANEDSFVYIGFNNTYTIEQISDALNDGSILNMLNKISVKTGDYFKIPSGTVYSIGKGITLYEASQGQDLSFRIYDYDRLDLSLNIEEGLKVINPNQYELATISDKKAKVLFASKYFEVTKFNIFDKYNLRFNENSFSIVTISRGQVTIDGEEVKRGESILVEPSTYIHIEGKGELLILRVADYGIGLDVGGTSIKGTIIDDSANKIAEYKTPTESEKGEDTIVEHMKDCFLGLIDISGFPRNFFTKVGVGFPGNIDTNNGIVKFSNNLGLVNSPIAELLSKKLGIEVIIDNDANCAALGEYYYTDKRKYHDMFLITLGTGVGGGCIIDGKLFKGGQGSITEVGHMKVKSDNVKCTCGQYGCFEALLSLKRLKMDIDQLRANPETGLQELISDDDKPLKIFSLDETNQAASEYVKKYQNNLLLGLVNVCNLFQPEIIVIGGGVSYVISKYIPLLERKMNAYKYSGYDAPKVKLVQASLGNEAGAFGAAALTKF
ncbi:ROK family protein [bacterium]|nr:ROK family protein [bacterium]